MGQYIHIRRNRNNKLMIMKLAVHLLFLLYSVSTFPIKTEYTNTSTDLESSQSDQPPSPPVIEDIEEDDIEYTDDYNTEELTKKQNKIEELAKEQNKNAKYSFGYRIQDEIKDGFMERQEEREGLAVRGQYSYSDGYFHHSVTYVADENGYRVTNMVSEPVNGGRGPVENEYGRAIVQTLIGNVKTECAIQNQREEIGTRKEVEDGREDMEDGEAVVSL